MSSLLPTQVCRQFSLHEILSATQNFDDALVVGKGGFGKVYKASITFENEEVYSVAIKRLNLDSSQGATEFWAEIEMLTKLRHCNLVSLIGYCNENSEMILIYEFMPQGTLDDHLHKKGTSLSWVQRLKISIGAARGLHYLHTGTGTQHGVIHRDVKSSNILLDRDFAAKISDFGLSKIGPTNTSGAYVNTVVRGTFGYLDPEYFLTGRLTRKSDVFAFGVVLFELLCGRAALDRSLDEDECSLAKWAHESIEEGKMYEIIDFNIKSQISPKCLKAFVQIADRCLSSESKKRPTMAEILVALDLSLTLLNKFDSHVKPAAAQNARKPSTINEVPIEHGSSSKEDSGEKLDHLNHVAEEHDDDHLEISSAGEMHSLDYDLKKLSLDDLRNATRDFDSDMRLCTGEFGEVFEGWISTKISSMSVDGLLRIAVNRFYCWRIEEKGVDMTFLREFNHPNLVKVLGYCFEDKTLFLVYEFMENGSLNSNLFSENKLPLPWKTRVHIAIGIAEALLFLNTTQKHADNRPIRLRYIMLDRYFNAKLSDYESAKLVYGDSYEKPIDPLYYYPLQTNSAGVKGGIHGFGVVLVQILTGQRLSKIGITNLRHMLSVTGEHNKESLRRALDPRLPDVDATTITEAMKLALLALDCLDNPSYTLSSALDVLRQL